MLYFKAKQKGLWDFCIGPGEGIRTDEHMNATQTQNVMLIYSCIMIDRKRSYCILHLCIMNRLMRL